MEKNSLENIFTLLTKVNELLKENGAFINIQDNGSVIIKDGLYGLRDAIVTISFRS